MVEKVLLILPLDLACNARRKARHVPSQMSALHRRSAPKPDEPSGEVMDDHVLVPFLDHSCLAVCRTYGLSSNSGAASVRRIDKPVAPPAGHAGRPEMGRRRRFAVDAAQVQKTTSHKRSAPT